MILSIIIAAFNIDQYIEKCIISCLDQNISHDQYEIIVVNDGSTDKTLDIISLLSTKYTNIRILAKDNGGLSEARNAGLDLAKGKYIWFIDGDDYIEPNCLNSLIDKLETCNLDVLCFNLKLIYPKHETLYKITYKEANAILNGEDFIVQVGMPHAAWAAIYKKEFLIANNLKFYKGILHEDLEFTTRAYCVANRISFSNQYIYNYVQREGSIMRSKKDEKRCKDFISIADSLYNFTRKNLKIGTSAYNQLMNRVFFSLCQSLAYYNKRIFALDVYREKPYYPFELSTLSKRNKCKAFLINISIPLYIFSHQLKQSINKCNRSHES